MVSKHNNRYISIRPNSKLKFFFWSDPFRLPRNDEFLSKLKEKEIQFVVALGKHTLNDKSYNRIQPLIEKGIGLNICILDKDFAHLDNSNRFIELYQILRKSKSFKYTKEIYIDAEISNKIRNLPIQKKLTYVFDRYPKEKEIKKAITNYNHLADLIHKDGKEFGIIRSIPSIYEFEKLTRNVPYEEIKSDITVFMTYRIPQGREKEFSDIWFYRVAKKEGANIFLGDIKDGYRSLKKDISICSYLKKKRVYIYDYYGFQKFCKLGDLEPNKYKLRQNSWESLKHISKFSSMEIVDKILRFFK